MKYLNSVGILLLIGVTSNATASCSTEGYPTLGTSSDISGKQILATAPPVGEQWNEDHCASLDLYKVGDGTAVDPYAYRGTWSITGNAVTYNYTVGGNSTYIWNLWKDVNGNLCWDDSTNIIATAPAPAGAGACSAP